MVLVMKLKQAHLDFIKDTGFLPLIGYELEFYIEGSDVKKALLLLQQFSYQIKPESGENQFEIIFPFGLDVVSLANQVEEFKVKAKLILEEIDHKIIFSAKAYKDRPSSGLHININLLDKYGKNVYARNGEVESDLMLYSIAGLMEGLLPAMRFFAPTKECYLRYNKEVFIKNGRKDIESPRTVSWGGNNRSVALRIPESSLQEHTRRIEHRVPSPMADANIVTLCIINDLKKGILHRLQLKYPKIYGNAYESQYNAMLLPQSLEEALIY